MGKTTSILNQTIPHIALVRSCPHFSPSAHTLPSFRVKHSQLPTAFWTYNKPDVIIMYGLDDNEWLSEFYLCVGMEVGVLYIGDARTTTSSPSTVHC